MHGLKSGGRVVAAVTAVCLAGLLTACANVAAPDQGGDGEEGGLTPMEVGLIPISVTAPVVLGEEQGFFEEAGIDLKISMMNSSPDIIAAVAAGSIEAGFGGMPSIIKAWDTGIPIQLVVGAERGAKNAAEDTTRTMVMCDGPIKTPKDLEGKKFAIGALGGVDNLAINAALMNGGADPEKVTLVEIPYANQFQALQAGEVDAMAASEPFNTIAEGQGACQLTYLFSEAGSGIPTAGYVMSTEFVEKNPELAQAFVDAVMRSNKFAVENPDEVKRILTTYTDMSQDIIDTVPLPIFPTEQFTVADLNNMASMMKQFTPYEGKSEATSLLWTP